MARDKSRKSGKALKSRTVSEPVAVRHTFSAGLLGHDLTASAWLINVSEQTALGLDVVQQCVQLIADAVAGSDVGQWNGTQKIDPPSGFTLRPDPDLTRREFLWLFTANLALYRAVYLEEATVGGQVVGVRLHCIANVMRQGDQFYVAGQLVRNRMKLVRLSVWPTLDIDTGSIINLAREVFAGAMSANAYASDFWQQGGAPVYYGKTEQNITTTQAEALQDRIVSQRTTSPGKPMVLGQGVDIKSFGADLGTDGANVSGDKLRASTARYFNVPPSFVNVLSEAGPLTYTTVEQESIRLVRFTIQPYCDVEGEALSAYLPGDYLLGDRIVINPNRLTTADQMTRFTAWESALRAGWIDAEEVRAAEGLPPGAPVREVANVGA